MIISHTHRFIFLKTRKTAGTSIEVFLSRLAGADAVVTPIRPAVPGHEARNYLHADRVPSGTFFQPRRHSIVSDSALPMYINHISAGAVRERLGPSRWNSYFKFCFERNPWDKVTSYYYWRKHWLGATEGFRHFVLESDLPVDFDLYSINGSTLSVDFVGQYGDLIADLSFALRQVGISQPPELGREKGGYRPDSRDTHVSFDKEMTKRIESCFSREIKMFGYSPPST